MGCKRGRLHVYGGLQEDVHEQVGRFLEDEAVRLNLSTSIIAVMVEFKNVFGLELG